MNFRIQEHVVTGIKTSKNRFVVANLARIIIIDFNDRQVVFIISRIHTVPNSGKAPQVHFMVAVMDFCTESQTLDWIELDATAISSCLDDDSIRIRLEFADSRV